MAELQQQPGLLAQRLAAAEGRAVAARVVAEHPETGRIQAKGSLLDRLRAWLTPATPWQGWTMLAPVAATAILLVLILGSESEPVWSDLARIEPLPYTALTTRSIDATQERLIAGFAAYQRAGDSGAVQRVLKNKETDEYNRQVEEEAAAIQRLQEEQEKIKKELEDLPGGPPPLG